MADYDAQPGRKAPPEPELSRAQRDLDDVDLHAGLSGVAGIVAGARGLIAVLGEVAEFAVQAIPGVDGAGVMLIDSCEDTSSIQTWAVTAEFVEDIDRVQYVDLHEGPCITCMQSRRFTVSGSLGSDNRWPRFGGRVARLGVHSALSLPLVVGEQVIGASLTYDPTREGFFLFPADSRSNNERIYIVRRSVAKVERVS